LLEGDWQSVSCEVEVQLIAEDNKETYVLARSRARAQKEGAMRSRVVRGLMRDLIDCAGCFAMAGSKTRRKFFSIWADSKSATGKLGDT
jgi:hypothetical protein